MPDNLKAAALAAQLSPTEQKKIDDFNKALQAHKELSNLPQNVAQQAYQKLTPGQQTNLVQNFGNEDPAVKQKRGWLGTAWHYTGGAVANAIGYTGSHILAGLGNVSDFSTRVARTVQIAGDQGVDVGTAWTIANDKGDKVFSPNRINDAKAKFGNDAVDIAMRIASGEDPAVIKKSATPEQIKYLMLADPTNTVIPGLTSPEEIKAARGLFQDTLDAVQASKYSPGRWVANLVLPADLEGSGLFYKPISGAVDAAYRVLADPLLIAGKTKRLYDVSKYALDVVIGAGKVDEVFAKPSVVSFFDQYGAKLQELTKAQEARNPVAIAKAKNELGILAPEFGPAVIKAFQKAEIPVTDALTAKAFFGNAKDVAEIIAGNTTRYRTIIPRMDPLRKLRVNAATTGNKIFDVFKDGAKFTNDYFYGQAPTTDGIAEAIINGQKAIVENVTKNTSFKGIARFSTNYIMHKIDRVKASFTYAPLFKNDVFDVMEPDAADKIYRIAVMVLPTKNARLLSEAFDNIDDVGKRKDVYYGLWKTITEVRGMNTTLPGQALVRTMLGKGNVRHGLTDEFADKGAIPSDFNNFVSVPTIQDLDAAAARNGWIQKVIGIANSDFASNVTSAWSFLTLAGPRYAVRNASEDLMVNLAIGESPWGIAKSRMLSTRLNTVYSAMNEGKGLAGKAEDPLGAVMRLVNKNDVTKYEEEIVGLNKKIKDGRSEVAKLKSTLKTTKDPVAAQDIKNKINDIEKGIKGGVVGQTRQILARALTEGKLNRFRAKLGLKPVNQEDAELLAEQIIYGNIDNVLADVSEGGFNFATGNDYISSARNLVRSLGVRTHNLTIDQAGAARYVKKAGERGYKVQAVSPDDEASMVTWLMRIGYYANDKLGAIAIANMGSKAQDETRAIREMLDWVNNTKQGQKFLSDARLQNDMDARGIVQIAYNRAKELFLKEDAKTLNVDLLNKIRAFDEESGKYVVSGKLSLDDLPTDPTEVPRNVVGPTLVPAVEPGQYAQNLMTNGWTWLGMANARMSRQPMVLEEMIRMRKQMRDTGFEAKWIESYTKNIDPNEATKIAAATRKAKQDLATVVEERAVGMVTSYVDNPLVRTQIAFASRNFARFYRATEDFYRRLYRIVRYNPQAVVKAALTYEGITHSGFVQKDDQGQDYFIYPGIAPVYNAVQNTLERLGIKQEFKVPFPVQFGAQLKMITPSLNPDSLVPTFSGPVAGLSIQTLSSLVNIWNPGAADTIQGYTMGKYAVNQPFLSAVLPAHINRLYAAMNQDDRNSQYASAYRKAVTYLEASGHGLPKKYDKDGTLLAPSAQEMEAYRLAVKNTTLTILGMRFVFGFFAPATPQVALKSDMAQWISDNGRANFKQAFNKLLDQYPGDYDAAMAKWVELFPNQIAFTIPESERKSLAPLRYSEEAGYFVDQNKDLFKAFPKAAGFLIPHKSGFSWDAYKTFKDEGLTQNKRVDDYLREVQTASDLQQYYSRKDQYEADLTRAFSPFEKTQIRQKFDEWKKVFFAGRPLVQEELSQGSQKAIDRLRTLDELGNMLSQNLGVRPKTEAILKQMYDAYSNYQKQKDQLDQFGGSTIMVDSLKNSTIAKLRELSNYNENTKAAYDVLFSRLPGIGG
jgi:hypothetical protein